MLKATSEGEMGRKLAWINGFDEAHLKKSAF